MKPVEQLTTAEIFDRLSIAVYYGAALRAEIHANPRARKAAETLIAELRQEEFLRGQLETA